MSTHKLRTPVAFIIFNRPDTTKEVFAEIANAKPPKLFVIADGPRGDHPDDLEKCTAARAIIEGVDWECEVLKNYSHVNLGCGNRVATGISWVFEHVDRAIILEDDCLPHSTFFRFCEELLEKYIDDERVMMIGGNNYLFSQKRMQYSYYFSRLVCLWGWGTWRRAWQHYDIEMKLWPELRDTPWLLDILFNDRQVEYWRSIFDGFYTGVSNVDTWDFQWGFACWSQNGLVILPAVNLVSNIGFGDDSTHTMVEDIRANVPTAKMVFPLKHPLCAVRDRETDQLIFDQIFGRKRPCLHRRVRRKLSVLVSHPVGETISYFRSKWPQI